MVWFTAVSCRRQKAILRPARCQDSFAGAAAFRGPRLLVAPRAVTQCPPRADARTSRCTTPHAAPNTSLCISSLRRFACDASKHHISLSVSSCLRAMHWRLSSGFLVGCCARSSCGQNTTPHRPLPHPSAPTPYQTFHTTIAFPVALYLPLLYKEIISTLHPLCALRERARLYEPSLRGVSPVLAYWTPVPTYAAGTFTSYRLANDHRPGEPPFGLLPDDRRRTALPYTCLLPLPAIW